MIHGKAVNEPSASAGGLQVTRFVHVADDAFDGNVADCFAEK